MSAQEFQTRTTITRRDEHNIIWVTVLTGMEETLDDAKATVQNVAILAAGARLPLLVDMRTVKSQDRDVRQYYGSEEVTRLATAIALLVESRLSMLIANFFMSVTKTTVPTRIFNNAPDALAWLKGDLT